MEQVTGENNYEKHSDNIAKDSENSSTGMNSADPNARFKPAESVTDLPMQERKPSAEDDNTNSSYIVKTAAARSKNASQARAAQKGVRGTNTKMASLPSVRPGTPTDVQVRAQQHDSVSSESSAAPVQYPNNDTQETQAQQVAQRKEQEAIQSSTGQSYTETTSKNNPDPQQTTRETDNTSSKQFSPSPSRHLAAMPDLHEDTQTSKAPASRAEFTTVYDILDKLESLLDEAKSSIFTPGIAKIDREEFMSALDDLKKMLPVQLERASALMRESERRLDNAQTQANAIVSEAQSQAADMIKEASNQAEFLAGQENIVAIAQRKGQAILEQAQTQSDKLIQGANEYSAKVMEALGSQLENYQQDVRAGIEVLRERERAAASKLEQSYTEEH